jgi:hypothetical protein
MLVSVSVLIANWSAAGESPSVRSNSGKVQRNAQQPGDDGEYDATSSWLG